MRLPNLLATRRGRVFAFFMLYVTEGIPQGFVTTAVATQLRRLGVGPAEIGAFIAAFYLPWAFKWAFGPFVDVFRSRRFGHRRAWILLSQTAMAATLVALVLVPLPEALWMFTAVLLVHNTFAAIQDVAIDSMACNTLGENERGLVNGMMFAGSTIGAAAGGAGVLFMIGITGFQPSFVFVAAAILAVTGFIVLPMKEARAESIVAPAGDALRAAGFEMKKFAVQSFRSFIGTRGAFTGVFFAILPVGAMSLALSLQTNLAVELGMNDDEVGTMTLWVGAIAAAFMVMGGWVSDRWGRRRTLAISVAGMSLPVLYLMWELQRHGYVMPRAPGGPVGELVLVLWIATLTYAAFYGVMYGTRTAILMDVTNPLVAATQFTAYTSLANLAIATSAAWQGIAAEVWGYPITLLIDAIVGLLCLLLVPALKRSSGTFSDDLAARRARTAAVALGIACLAWIPYWANHEALGKAQPIAGTFFNLVFVASALFLLAGREVLNVAAGRWRRASLLTAPLLLLMYCRQFTNKLPQLPVLHSAVEALIFLIPLAGGIALMALASRSWAALDSAAQAA